MLSHQRRQHALASAHADLRPKLQPPARHERDVVIRSWLEHGKLCHSQSKMAEAEQFYDAILRSVPTHVEAQYLKLFVILQQARFDESLKLAKRLLRSRPEVDLLHYAAGVAQAGLQLFSQALDSLNTALSLKPDHIDALFNRGYVLGKLDRKREALADYERILMIQPHHEDALTSSANIQMELGEPAIALARYQAVLMNKPDKVGALLNTGRALRGLNRHEDALELIGRAVSLDQTSANAFNDLGTLLSEVGRLAEAQIALERAIELEPTSCRFYQNYAIAHRFTGDDPNLRRMLSLAKSEEKLGTEDRAILDYALGKAHADIAAHAEAFNHFSKGAALMRMNLSYDDAFAFRYFDRIESLFSDQLIKAKSGSGNPSDRPIFVMGMPRSGSSLIEQILASHPQVMGAGELPILNAILPALALKDRPNEAVLYPEYVSGLNASDFGELARAYLTRCAPYAREDAKFTDKLPSNFFYLGLIHLMLPNARIIHTVRDPMDTCVSCFTNYFAGNQDYTYNLGELGRFYKRYQRLMEHWRRVLPEGAFIDVRYEDMVADTEAQARRLLDYCGLPWDDACLRFYEAKRLVKTASSRQVREPIYSRSVGRWRDYEPWLGPLKAELGIS